MNSKNTKAVRSIVRKQKDLLMHDAMKEIMSADLRTRLRFCWLVVKGVKRKVKK